MTLENCHPDRRRLLWGAAPPSGWGAEEAPGSRLQKSPSSPRCNGPGPGPQGRTSGESSHTACGPHRPAAFIVLAGEAMNNRILSPELLFQKSRGKAPSVLCSSLPPAVWGAWVSAISGPHYYPAATHPPPPPAPRTFPNRHPWPSPRPRPGTRLCCTDAHFKGRSEFTLQN